MDFLQDLKIKKIFNLTIMKRIYTILLFLQVLTLGTFAQKTVGLDNWFNREVNTKTGKVITIPGMTLKIAVFLNLARFLSIIPPSF